MSTRMPRDVWQRVHDREGGSCLRCGKRGEVVHHRQGRGGADPHALGGLAHLCVPCHLHIHAHPAESYESGWMVRRLGEDDPEQIPVETLRGELLFLINDGAVIRAWGADQ